MKTIALRMLAAAALALLLSSCSGGGIDAGVQGGRAFMLFAAFLVAGCLILWFILGRED